MDKIERFGLSKFEIIAGPCTIENYENLYNNAQVLKELGIKYLRGGAYKMRTSFHSFRGLGDSGVIHLENVGKELDMITVSECTQIDKVEYMAQHIDVLVVGTRNMHNYPLLEALGNIDKPIILKRGIAATYDEWMAAAGYIIDNGNEQVILCERGIRTFVRDTRYTFDVSAIAVMKRKSGLPVIADPSHAAGNRNLVPSLAYSAIAAGADGLLLECTTNPSENICDADQTIEPQTLKHIIDATPNLRRHLLGTN